MGRLEEILRESSVRFEHSDVILAIINDKRIKEAMQQYAKECVIASLDKASYPSDEYGNPKSLLYENGDFHVPQSSITSEKNIILL